MLGVEWNISLVQQNHKMLMKKMLLMPLEILLCLDDFLFLQKTEREITTQQTQSFY